jgi:hypothetical protein
MGRYDEQSPVPLKARSHAEVSRFFDGLDLVDHRLVQSRRWRPGPGDLDSGRELPKYGRVGWKA